MMDIDDYAYESGRYNNSDTTLTGTSLAEPVSAAYVQVGDSPGVRDRDRDSMQRSGSGQVASGMGRVPDQTLLRAARTKARKSHANRNGQGTPPAPWMLVGT